MADNVRGFVISSLNQFNSYLAESILPAYAGYSYVYAAYSYLLDAIYDNEYVTAYALIQLNERIDGIDTIDLSSYALKTTLNSYVQKSQLSSQSYVTTTALSNQGYLTSSDLSDYATKAYTFSEYPSYTYLESRLANVNVDLSTYVSKTELTNASYITYAYAFSEYPSYTYLDEKLANIDLSTYVSKTELSTLGYITSIPNTYATYTAISDMGYVTQTSLSANSYAGYSYVYDSYAYIMGKINTLELATGGGGSGTSAEGGITAISFNGTAASITGSVASIIAPINDPAIEIQIDNATYSFTLNQSTTYSINLGTVLRSHQDLSTYVSKTELSNQSYATSSDLNNYVTKTELSNAGYITSGLPSVTSNDNGKILMVVNGAWSLVLPSTIYSGNATPSNANGNNGDIYLQS